jgi:hypothetical protein
MKHPPPPKKKIKSTEKKHFIRFQLQFSICCGNVLYVKTQFAVVKYLHNLMDLACIRIDLASDLVAKFVLLFNPE